MPLLFWGVGALGTAIFGAVALKQADETAKNVTIMLVVAAVGYFLILNPKILRLKE